ncbi:molybdenum ABC transporter, periplasmic molybdate-binding protein [Synechococcus sp. PCC 7502]|uniref:molybdate ABC transporter substrate-binding protein n=1 Tax=Synechococcus sp. PCC 7502 TaxID=1173263 RepID=UPI00029FCFAD|nr:molybdate ABC transporter substrate-binding protein [Synechococcus sp. PCC 7502]AFY74478.1 molybdenum ABC transporter, periplasmic molybdate-binding protein [Synechococcus sp. PCC 7502]
MKNLPKFLALILGISFGIVLSLISSVTWAQTSGKLLVSAAASLQPVLQEIRSIDSTKITYNFGSSGALQQQIEQGAPIDVFISAGVKQMDTLESKGLLSFKANLLTNQLVLITPKSSPIKLTNFLQLLNANIKRIAIGETRSVPAGQYAKEALENLGIFEQLQSKFVLGNNVRFVLTAVESGEVDAGIIYITDAKSSDKVLISAIADQKLYSPIIYPVGIIKSSKNPRAAKGYVEFLQTKAASSVFEKYGFGVISVKS